MIFNVHGLFDVRVNYSCCRSYQQALCCSNLITRRCSTSFAGPTSWQSLVKLKLHLLKTAVSRHPRKQHYIVCSFIKKISRAVA